MKTVPFWEADAKDWLLSHTAKPTKGPPSWCNVCTDLLATFFPSILAQSHNLIQPSEEQLANEATSEPGIATILYILLFKKHIYQQINVHNSVQFIDLIIN